MRTYVVAEYYSPTNHDVSCGHTHATLEEAALCYREHRYAWSDVVAVTDKGWVKLTDEERKTLDRLMKRRIA